MNDWKKIEAQAADWIAQRDRAEGDANYWSADREHDLQVWLEERPEHRVAFLRLEHAWERADRLRALRPATAPSRLKVLSGAKLSFSKLKLQPRRLSAFAAIATGVLLLCLYVAWPYTTKSVDYGTKLGEQAALALADGSHLTLNTQTRLRAEVTANTRHVWLDQGEAFFEIAHDSAHPFVVEAGRQRITVLGTKFSLRRDGDSLHVNVVEGSVQVESDERAVAVLKHDEVALVESNNVLINRSSTQRVHDELAWMRGKIVFEQATLGDVVREFNRYNNKKLVLVDASASSIVVGGSFDTNNAEAFARLLHVGFGLTVRDAGDEILISTPAS